MTNPVEIKTLKLNNSEASFSPVAMVEDLSGSDTESGVSFDGYIRNSQLNDQAENIAATSDEKQNVVCNEKEKIAFHQPISNENGQNNAATQNSDSISVQKDDTSSTQRKHRFDSTTLKIPQLPFTKGLNSLTNNEGVLERSSTGESSETKDIKVKGSDLKSGQIQVTEKTSNLGKDAKNRTNQSPEKTDIIKSGIESGKPGKSRTEYVNINHELTRDINKNDSVKSNFLRYPIDFSTASKGIIANESGIDSSKAAHPAFEGGRFEAINNLSPSLSNLTGVSMTRMVQRITKFIFTSVSRQYTQTNLTIDGGRLGPMEIQYTSESSAKQITIVVETEAVRDAMQKLIPVINENLFQKGVKPSSIDVQVNSDKHNETFEKDQDSLSEENKPDQNEGELVTVQDLNIGVKDYGYNTMEVLA